MNTPCDLWAGRVREDGYGTIGSQLAHRRAWEAVYGPIPPGLELHHLCHVRACVALDHLALVTHQRNLQLTAEAGRHREQQKAACPQGHPYDGASGGKRYCTICKRAAGRRRRSRAR